MLKSSHKWPLEESVCRPKEKGEKKPLEQVTYHEHKARKSLTSAQWSAEPKLSLLSPQCLGPKEGQGDAYPLPRHLGRIEETS